MGVESKDGEGEDEIPVMIAIMLATPNTTIYITFVKGSMLILRANKRQESEI